jgi:hypothetical protein
MLKDFQKAVEPHHGAMNAHHGAMEAHLGAIDSHHVANHNPVEAHSGDIEVPLDTECSTWRVEPTLEQYGSPRNSGGSPRSTEG